MARSKKPAPVTVEPVHARPIRGPHKDGSGRWYWQARLFRGEKGGDRTVWAGWGSRDEVATALVALISNEGLDKRDEDEAVETVRDLFEHWVGAQSTRVDVSDSWRRSAKHAGRRICAVIGDVFLERVDRATIERYRDQAIRTESNASGIASSTVRQDLKKLRAAWRWGRELRLTPNTELPDVPVKVIAVRQKFTPSRDQVLAVLDAMDEAWPRLVVVLLFATGARIGEIARLTWADVDLDTATVSIREGKTGARTVPIHTEIVDELRAWRSRDSTPDPSEGLFGVTWKLVRSKLGTGPLKRACEASGVPKFTPHGLRRLAVDTFLRASVDVGAAASFLGHSPSVLLTYYRKATMDDHRRTLAVSRLGVLSREGADVIPFPKGSEGE